MQRKKTHTVDVGGVLIGGTAPIVIQAMTNTSTADISATAQQVLELADAGAQVVRITVNDEEAAKAVPAIRDIVQREKNVPLIGCFHYNGHQLLKNHPACAQALAKYRINPGNVGFGTKRDKNFEEIITIALQYDKPIRIGVNWGSIDQEILTNLMNTNNTRSSTDIMIDAMWHSCLMSASTAEAVGLSPNKIILSAKISRVPELIQVYTILHEKCDYALHLGLTEAGIGMRGIVAITSAIAILLQKGIGDTIRASLTPRPEESRSQEVKLCCEILQSLNLRSFNPQVSACPGCGRTTNVYFQKLADDIQNFLDTSMKKWRFQYHGVENLKVAVMGCIVNGPGESKHADIGISLPGTNEHPTAPVFIDGKRAHILKGENILKEFQDIILSYITDKFPKLD